eukprot:6680437-Alexandrium_andersonii.AAC.1
MRCPSKADLAASPPSHLIKDTRRGTHPPKPTAASPPLLACSPVLRPGAWGTGGGEAKAIEALHPALLRRERMPRA